MNRPWTIVFASLCLMATLHLQARAKVDSIQTNVPPLKQVYAHDFYIGCLLSYAHVGFASDPPVPGQSAVVDTNGGYLIKFHMNSMSPGNNMKPQYTVDLTSSAAAYTAASADAKDSVDTHPLVKFNGNLIAQLNWAQRQGFRFRGHTLVWHSQTPTAFFRSGYVSTGPYLSKDKMTQRMDWYIHEVIRLLHESWPGLLFACDVVNEAIDDNSGRVRTTGNDWYATFGDSTYVMKAFQSARNWTTQLGEPQIKLYYNDYNTENPAKADGIVRLLTPIYQAGYLDGIGMQEHNNLSSPTAAGFIASYNKFYPICTEMAVTELDVACGAGNAYPSASVLASQANQYGMLFKCFVERSFLSGRGKIINVSKDGLDDSLTFQTLQSSSLWDQKDRCKPSFFAAVGVGMKYNAVDSLVTFAGTLQQSKYTPASWSALSVALASAVTAKNQNYSVSVSADTALGRARDSLKAALDGLVITSVGPLADNIPAAFALGQNYPNPFNPSTTIEFALPSSSPVSLTVYNLLGERVAEPLRASLPAGRYRVRFDASSLPSGIYLYRLRAGDAVLSRRMIVLK